MRKIIIKKGKKFYNNLSQIIKETGVETGVKKPNVLGDINYIPPVLNPLDCPTTYFDKLNRKEIEINASK
jgi:hypothetical protein